MTIGYFKNIRAISGMIYYILQLLKRLLEVEWRWDISLEISRAIGTQKSLPDRHPTTDS